MKFTDIFIIRPVLATVISLFIFVIGLASIENLTLRQYPNLEVGTVTVMTIYAGANQALVQGFVTSPIEQAVSSVEGIDYVSANSTTGMSMITVRLKLNYNTNTAINDINAAIQSIRYQLPTAIQDPVVSKGGSKGSGVLYLAYYSQKFSPEQITDYLSRAIVPKLETVDGVSQAQILGARSYSMRIRLNPKQMTALQVTADDVQNALLNNNVQAAPGNLEGKSDLLNVSVTSDISTPEQFNNIVIRNDQGTLIRIKDIGHAELGPANTDFGAKADNQDAVVLEIDALPSANTLSVASGVIALLPQLATELPPELKQTVLYNSARFIQESIHAVVQTLIEAVIIVLIVIFLFLGTLRAVSVPIVTIPLSLVGVCFLMLLLGYSINVLTLLAMILAIGLVVDDAIVVVENINRHLELGETAFQAAMKGAREICMPVVSMSTTLAAVFIPIGFMGGLTGKLFTEFAFTLAASVIISGVIALTLSPMMCSKIMNEKQLHNRFVEYVDRVLLKVNHVYRYLLQGTLNAKYVTLLFSIVVLVSCFILYASTKEELAPQEDQGFVVVYSLGPANANIDYTTKYMGELSKIFQTIKEKQTDMTISGMDGINTGLSFIVLKPNSERTRTALQIEAVLQKQIAEVAGLQSFIINPPTLPGTDLGAPIQFVLTTLGSYDSLNTAATAIQTAAQESHMFFYVRNDLQMNSPQVNVTINRNLMADLGIQVNDIATALSTVLGDGNTNYFNLQGRSYPVIPQAFRQHRLNPDDIKTIYIRTASNDMIPLSSLVTISYSVQPNGLSEFQQLNSATLEVQPMPGMAMGTAMSYMQNLAQQFMPDGMTYNFTGQSRQYLQQSSMAMTFVFALIFIFLILSAQFESFREPLIILISVPTAICGALIFLNIGLGTINIFTKIGLITLIGLIAKQGILIVEFANQLQVTKNLSIAAAVLESACIRLRPILMTTATLVFGSIPLLLSTEGLVNSQRQLAIVIIAGTLLGTLMTIFIVPVFYLFLADDKREHLKRLEHKLNS